MSGALRRLEVVSNTPAVSLLLIMLTFSLSAAAKLSGSVSDDAVALLSPATYSSMPPTEKDQPTVQVLPATQTNWAGISSYYLYSCNATIRTEALNAVCCSMCNWQLHVQLARCHPPPNPNITVYKIQHLS